MLQSLDWVPYYACVAALEAFHRIVSGLAIHWGENFINVVTMSL